MRNRIIAGVTAVVAIVAGALLYNPTSNLLKNPTFELQGSSPVAAGFTDWDRVADIWKGSKKQANPSPNRTAAEMDQDWGSAIINGVKTKVKVGWMYGDEDWLSQLIATPQEHTTVLFGLTEIHHVSESEAVITLFCKDGVDVSEIAHRPDLSTIPRAVTGYDWHTNLYTLVPKQEDTKGWVYPEGYVDHTCPEYLIEFYGKYLSETGQDGWKITNLVFEVN